VICLSDRVTPQERAIAVQPTGLVPHRQPASRAAVWVLHGPDDATPPTNPGLTTHDLRLSNHSQRVVHHVQRAIERGILDD
jgi:hypothetical protein